MASLALAFDILARDRGASKTFDKVGRSAEGAGKKGSAFGGAIKKAAGVAAAALAAAGIADIFRDVVSAGSELQQNLGGAEAVFKDSFGGINKTAKGAAKNLGLSQSAYLELATVLGAGLKNKGIKDFGKQSQNLVGIGADLAAQYGGSTKDAVAALASAMRGESDPIERYGVALNETAVNAELAAKGVQKGKAGYTEQQKTMARLSIITRQTADAQGAFGRESETLAGKQARLSASWDDMKAQLGTKLLPVLTKVAGWFLDKGLPAIQRFGGWLTGKLWPAIQQGYKTILPGIQQALAIVTGGVGDGTVSWKKIGDVITTRVIPFIALLIRTYLPVLATNIRTGIEVVKKLYSAFQTWRSIVSSVISFVLKRFADLSGMWAGVLRALGKVPGFGWAKDAAAKLQGAADKANGLATAIDNIDKDVKVGVTFKVNGAGQVTLANGVKVAVGQFKARALGGPVVKGQPYIVGERRPEVFVPSSNGRIEPRVSAERASAFAGGKVALDESSLQRLAAMLSNVRTNATISAGSVDSAIGASLR